jgi:hypothetical protein
VIPKPRNSGPVGPVRVGQRQSGGEVSAALIRRGGEVRVSVNVSQGLGMAVDISVDAARELYDGLAVLLERARQI